MKKAKADTKRRSKSIKNISKLEEVEACEVLHCQGISVGGIHVILLDKRHNRHQIVHNTLLKQRM